MRMIDAGTGKASHVPASEGKGGAFWVDQKTLLEAVAHDEYGQLMTGTLVDYALPTAGVVPPIDTEIVEVPVPEGPFGAKGVGEAPVIAGAGAVANAIAAATGGVRMRRLPMTPERLLGAMKQRKASEAGA